MDTNFEDLRSWKNPKARVKIMKGHFVTTHSHVNTYIDLSTMKSRCNNARETAKVMAEPYLASTEIDTIVCLDGMEVVGTFIADILSRPGTVSINTGKNISVVTPETDRAGQMIFRDNTKRMIDGQRILIVAGLITTGKTIDAVHRERSLLWRNSKRHLRRFQPCLQGGGDGHQRGVYPERGARVREVL